MAERTLSTRVLNRALLARQLLLERADLPLARALERLGGLQAQYAPSPYIALWSRLRGFRREALTRALSQRKAVQGTLMRSTIHIVSAPDYPLMAEGIRRGRQESWLRVQGHRVEAKAMETLARRLQLHLADGPLSRSDLMGRLQAEGFPPMAWSGAGLWLDMVRVPPSGTWERRRADLYGPADGWLEPSAPTQAEAMKHLLRRYLGAFGPASLGDAAQWAGLNLSELRPSRSPATTLSRRAGSSAARFARRPVARPGNPIAGTLSSHVGRLIARPCPPHPDPAGGLSRAGLQYQDSAFSPDISGRWLGCGHLALRG